jgi:transitional endoplasmic reticulum ATPase
LLDKLVYNADVLSAIEANIFTPIRYPNSVKKLEVGLKRVICLHGPYGTGKTLTALDVARTAIAYGWTFFNVLPGDDIVAALAFAKQYQPTVLFAEDIDRVAGTERTDSVNSILNHVDGLLSKNDSIICVMTSNDASAIQEAMLRPGRIDNTIELGAVNREAFEKLIKAYVGNSLDKSVNADDFDKLFSAAQGYTPAFVAEACK